MVVAAVAAAAAVIIDRSMELVLDTEHPWAVMAVTEHRWEGDTEDTEDTDHRWEEGMGVTGRRWEEVTEAEGMAWEGEEDDGREWVMREPLHSVSEAVY